YQAQEVGVVICPRLEVVRTGNSVPAGMRGQALKIFEPMRGNQVVRAALTGLPQLARVVKTRKRYQAFVCNERRDQLLQVEITIGNIEKQKAVGLELVEIHSQGFAGEQMRWDGV